MGKEKRIWVPVTDEIERAIEAERLAWQERGITVTEGRALAALAVRAIRAEREAAK